MNRKIPFYSDLNVTKDSVRLHMMDVIAHLFLGLKGRSYFVYEISWTNKRKYD